MDLTSMNAKDLTQRASVLWRRHIVDATRRVTAEHGFCGTEVADILAEDRVSRATFYRYFPDGKGAVLRIVEEQTCHDSGKP